MGYLMIWVLTLIASLLVMALAAVFTSRVRAKWLGRIIFIIVFLLVLTPMAGAVAFCFAYIDKGSSLQWLKLYFVSLAVGYIIGTVAIIKRGTKVGDSETTPVNWSAARLALLLLIVLSVDYACTKSIAAFHQIEAVKWANVARIRFAYLSQKFVPDHKNAYKIYLKAAKSDVKPPNWLFDTSKPTFDPTNTDTTRYLDANMEKMDLLHQASRLEDYYIEANIVSPVATEIEQFYQIRSMAQTLLAQAKRQALNQEPRACLRSLTTITQMAEHLYSRPMIISAMLGGALESFYSVGLEYALTHVDTWPSDILTPPEVWATDRIEYFRRAMQAEIDLLVTFLDSDISETILEIVSTENRPNYWFKPLDLLYRVFLLPADLKVAPEIMRLADSLVSDQSELIKVSEDVYKPIREKGSIWFKLVIPELSNYAIKVLTTEAKLRLCRLALAAAAFKSDHNRWPNSLDELAPLYIDIIPKDPFSDQRLQMKTVEGGFDLLSVGPTEMESKEDKSIHFYLGQEAYHKFRIEPALAQKDKKKKSKKK